MKFSSVDIVKISLKFSTIFNANIAVKAVMDFREPDNMN